MPCDPCRHDGTQFPSTHSVLRRAKSCRTCKRKTIINTFTKLDKKHLATFNEGRKCKHLYKPPSSSCIYLFYFLNCVTVLLSITSLSKLFHLLITFCEKKQEWQRVAVRPGNARWYRCRRYIAIMSICWPTTRPNLYARGPWMQSWTPSRCCSYCCCCCWTVHCTAVFLIKS